MKKKVSAIWTGSVISAGIISLGTVVAVCAAPPLAIPLAAKLGLSIAGLIGVAFSAGDTAVNHFSNGDGEQSTETKAQGAGDNDGNSADIRQLSCQMEGLIQKVDEILHHQTTIARDQNTAEMQGEKEKKEQNAKTSLLREDVDSLNRRMSVVERKTSSHGSKAPATSSGTSSPTSPIQEQTDDIPEGVSTLLSKHGLHSSNQSESSQPSDVSSARKRRTPTNLRM